MSLSLTVCTAMLNKAKTTHTAVPGVNEPLGRDLKRGTELIGRAASSRAFYHMACLRFSP